MLEWMKKTGDPALAAFKNRNSPEALKKFMAEQDLRAGRKKQNKKATKAGNRKPRSG
jgi:hypothetical protein